VELRLQFQDYLEMMRDESSQPASLDLLARPFGIRWPRRRDTVLLVGHILDAMSDYIQPTDPVDCIDVATAAWDLGCVDADRFLDEAPEIMFQHAHRLLFKTGLN
jgi:hypothetical protein